MNKIHRILTIPLRLMGFIKVLIISILLRMNFIENINMKVLKLLLGWK